MSSTQVKTISVKLNSANTGKLDWLDNILEDVECITRDFLEFKKQQLVDSKEHDYKSEFNSKYKEYREQYPDLNSAILQNTMRWARDKFMSHVKQCKKNHEIVKYPNINIFPIQIKNQIFSVQRDDRHFQMWFRFCMKNFPLNLSSYHKEVLENTEKLGGSEIVKIDDDWVLHLCCHVKCDSEVDSDETIGVDLGVVNPIVCSDGKRIGNGNRIRHKQKEFQKKRSKQQLDKKKITNKQRRWMKDQNHKLSRELVDYATSSGAGVLVLEDLKGTRLSNGYHRQYKWAFSELKTFIDYKAKLAGIEVISVDPAYTSQTCNSCGYKSSDNRQTRSLMECSRCGTRADADVNAAKNIRGLSAADGPPVNQAKRPA